MTWDAYNRRKTTLREILAVADRDATSSAGLTADELLERVPGARDVFTDDATLLREVQMVWFQRLSGQLDRLGAETDDAPEIVAVSAWAATAAQLPGARALLDTHRDRPELATALAKERAMLSAASGSSGARIIHLARQRVAAAPDSPEDDDRGGLMARLRNALAA